jgi:hypothetical protein
MFTRGAMTGLNEEDGSVKKNYGLFNFEKLGTGDGYSSSSSSSPDTNSQPSSSSNPPQSNAPAVGDTPYTILKNPNTRLNCFIIICLCFFY